MLNQNVLAASLAAALGTTTTPPNVKDSNDATGKGKGKGKGKIVAPNDWRKGIDAADAALTDKATGRMVAAIEEFAAATMDRQAENDAWNARTDTLCLAIHPNGKVGADLYFTIVRAIREHYGPYVATCYRDAVRRLPGMKGTLPNKADKRSKGGIKGYSPRKWYAGVHSSIEKLAERIEKMPAGSVNIDAARALNDAFRALLAAEKKLAKAVNE